MVLGRGRGTSLASMLTMGALFLGALGLGGCAEDPPQTGAKVDSRVDVPKPGGPPPIPKNMSMTESGAKYFVGYWIDAYNYGLRTGRTKIVRGLSTPDCVACATLADAMEAAHEGKAKVTSLGIESVPMEVRMNKREKTAQVKFFVIRYPVKIKRGKGQVEKIKPGVAPIRFTLVRHKRTWRVQSLELVPVKDKRDGATEKERRRRR
ncbi:hypothetical protein ASD66_19350 [Nocardioides sp. Root151]|nr:hypothetical protein ASD66_19350 [Nocardioides sp. Root151]